MKKIIRISSLVFIGIASFLFFVYVSFPYSILKETIAVNVVKNTGISVSIKELGPSFFLGIKAKDITLSSLSSSKFTLKEVDVSLSLLSLFVGKIAVDITVRDSKNGFLELYSAIGVFDLLAMQSLLLPSSVDLKANKFEIGKLANFGIKVWIDSGGVNPLLKPVLEKIVFSGRLNSNLDLSLSSQDFTKSSGSVTFKIVGASVEFDKKMGVPDQIFSKANVTVNLRGGNIEIDRSSGFRSPGLDMKISGKIKQNPKILKSNADLKIQVNLYKKLKDELGSFIPMLFSDASEDELKLKISGPLNRPRIGKF